MESRFDAVAKALAGGMSRRDALRKVGGSVTAAALAYFGIGCEVEQPTGPPAIPGSPRFAARGRCKKSDQKCRVGSECCSDFCNPSTGTCVCGPGTYVCAATDICVACHSSTVFDPLSCTCRCPTNTVVCGTATSLVCCPIGQSCVNGACSGTTTCSTGLTLCGNTCVDLTSNASHCGSCTTYCVADQSCVNSVCVPTNCPVGQTRCGTTCVDLSTSATNCGACGNACASGESCVSGVCTPTSTCPSGQTECGTTCVDTQSDPSNCGACGNVCPSGPNSLTTCQNGTCTFMCLPGFSDCTGTQTGCTTNILSDPANCGGCHLACAAGRTCTNGICTSVCGPGQTFCNGVCVNVMTDPNNCGQCNFACPPVANATRTCASGVCSFTCNAGYVNCGGTCVNIASNPANCGGCGLQCPSGAICVNGNCVCPFGQPVCGSSCCPEGSACCSGSCTDLAFDSNNCGACGFRCFGQCSAPGGGTGIRQCIDGVCECIS